MAGYTATVSDPGPVTGSTPTHQSVGEAIGGALGGLAKVLDVGLKASAEYRQDKLLGNLEDQLTEQAEAWGPKKSTPALIGEQTDPAADAMASAPGLKRGFGQLDSLRQGNQQGEDRVSTAEFMGRASVIVQRMIHDHPRFADAIRERAQKMLGTNPTAEMINLNHQDEEQQKKAQEAVQLDLVKSATDVGFVQLDTKTGGIDMAATASHGLIVKKTEHDLKTFGIGLDDKYKQLEIDRLEHPERYKTQTVEEKQSIQQNALRNLIDPEFDSAIDAAFHNLDVTKLLKGGDSPQAAANMLTAIGQTKATIMGRVQQLAMAAKDSSGMLMDTKVIGDVTKMYEQAFAPWEDLAKGPLSEFESMKRSLEMLQTRAGLKFATASPFLFQLKESLKGDTALSTIVAGLTQAAGSNRNLITGKLQNMFDEMSGVANGTSQITTPPVGKASLESLDVLNTNPNGLKPEERGAWGNMTSAVISQGLNYGTASPGQVQAVADKVSSAGAMRNFDLYVKEHPETADKLGSQLIDINRHNVDVQAANIKAVTIGGQPEFRTANKMATNSFVYDTVYNALTGRAELRIMDKEGKDMTSNPRLLQNAPPDMIAKINSVNRSLTAAAHFRAFGTDQDKNLTDPQFKLAIAAGAHLSVKPGTLIADGKTADGKPKEVEVPKLESSAAVEGAGNSDDPLGFLK